MKTISHTQKKNEHANRFYHVSKEELKVAVYVEWCNSHFDSEAKPLLCILSNNTQEEENNTQQPAQLDFRAFPNTECNFKNV